MEINNSNQEKATAKPTEGTTMVGVLDDKVEENKADGEALKDVIGDCKYHISAPLFLLFAEYLGYVGKTLDWVDELCVDKKMLPDYKNKFIEIEAVSVLREAKKKFTIERIRELYDELYEVILFIYDNNLKEVYKDSKLPI